MTQTVAVPLWLLILILLFAAVTFASHFLFPSVRWFFRRRMERVVARLNTRLARPISPFKLATRHDTIQRLIYDPEVTRAVVDHARREKVPEAVAFERARDIAREIVPSFSATAYFTIGARLAKWLSRSFYRVRLQRFDRDALSGIDPEAAVVFVMNHRSNMDYVLVTYLIARASALSYAVGEWARIWPLSAVIRAMGAFFIRRRDRGQLYRRVLARYVQLATAAGVTQAFFPEGALSLTGRIATPKMGILSYIAEDYRPGGREVVFVPVAISYDRVFEDSFLVKAARTGIRRFRPPLSTVVGGTFAHLWRRVTRRYAGFGEAAVSFGDPLRLSDFLTHADGAPVDALAAELMRRIACAVPATSVPLVARHLLDGPLPRSELVARIEADRARLDAASVSVPWAGAADIVTSGLAILGARGAVSEGPAGVSATAARRDLVAYYAASVAHHFEPEAHSRLPDTET